MGWIDAAMQQLWVAQKTAAAPGYHNSYGKDFVKCLLNYVLLSQNKSSNISAFVSKGSGPLQPGHMTVRWELERMERRSTVRGDDHSLHHSLYEIILLDFALLLKKTLIGVINHFRLLRAHNPSVLSCTGFAFPKKARRACVAKITVTFVDFTFRYRIEYLTRKEEVAGALTQVLMDRLQNPIPIAVDNHFLYFIRLSQEDCDKLQPNLEQVASQSSILLRTRDGAKYFKHHIEQPTLKFAERIFLAERGCILQPQNSLLPESVVRCDVHTFHQYKGLVEPYSREEAKGQLIAIY